MPDWLWTTLTVAGALGMAACLYGMYGDKKHGFPALTALDKDFKSLDMRPGYRPEDAFACFDGVGPQGQQLLGRLWRVDFCFILFFAMVMAAVTHNVARAEWAALVMYAAAALRALTDGAENALLMKANKAYPLKREEGVLRAACVATRVKWLMMALWVAGMFGNLLLGAAGR